MAKARVKAKTTASRKRKTSTWKERNLIKATSTIRWLERLKGELQRSGCEYEDAASALVYVGGIGGLLDDLADDWQPIAKLRNGAFHIGDAVRLKEEAEDAYVFIPDLEKKLAGAAVVDVFDKHTVLVQLSDGAKTLMQKRHLEHAIG